ncbi:hypothetical protein R3P38DRAFT_3206265 [Favolaschia claudopus]|uniref:Uncharacterized protein n=1 Tax=Favolaschia claudopus TaxID=2862362 RepID=A0AAW0AM80_9AGAR
MKLELEKEKQVRKTSSLPRRADMIIVASLRGSLPPLCVGPAKALSARRFNPRPPLVGLQLWLNLVNDFISVGAASFGVDCSSIAALLAFAFTFLNLTGLLVYTVSTATFLCEVDPSRPLVVLSS